MSKRILITGCAGLIGSNLARWIVGHTDDQVFGIDDVSCGLRQNIPRGMTWREMTLGRGHSYRYIESERPNIVYHFAAYAAECLSPFVRCHNYQNNLVATAEIVNACIRAGVERLVFTSSAAVYGNIEAPYSEDATPIPMDPYGVAKLACEHDIRIAGEQHGLDWCILRPHNVYGPGQSPWQAYRNVFGIWMDRHMRGLPLQVYGDGGQRRAFTFIGDILEPLFMAGMNPAASRQTINLGGSQPISVLDAAHTLAGLLDGAEIEHVDARHEVRDCWCTTQLSQQLLGYRDRTDLDTGLWRMWRWVQQATRERAMLPAIEVSQGVPGYWLRTND